MKARLSTGWTLAALLLVPPLARAEQPLAVPFGPDTLAATVFPSQQPGRRPALLLMQGSERLSRDLYRKFAVRFAREGFVAVTFDRRGEGGSTGTWDAIKTLEPIAAQGHAVLRAVARRADVDSTFLAVFGVSQGGWTATMVAAREPAVRLAILVSDPALTTHEENLNERAWEMREKGGYTEAEIREVTDVRRVLWRYYGTDVRPADFDAFWQRTTQKPWFERVGWPKYTPMPDSLRPESRANFRHNHDPVPHIRGTRAAVLRLYGTGDHHIDVRASMAAARAAYAGLDPDTTFVLYKDRGHILQSTAAKPECRTCPHDMAHIDFDFEETVWRDILDWMRPRLRR